MQESVSRDDLQGAKYIYDDPRARIVIDQHVNRRKQLGAVLLSQAAAAAGVSVEWINNVTCLVTTETKSILILGYIHNQDQVAARIVGNKFLTKDFLQSSGVSTPDGLLVGSEEEALNAWKQLGNPVTLKPLGAYGGKGIVTDVDDEVHLRDAFASASAFGRSVLVEQHIHAVEEYRALATPEKCVSVVKRVLPYVIGDGKSSIADLIREKNEIRKLNPSHVRRPIPTDKLTQRYLARQGLGYSHIPDEGHLVYVRDVGGLSSGGEAYECLEEVDPEIRETARRAVAAIPGLTWGGCDLLVERVTGKPFVIEVNSTPGIAGSMYPVFGRPRNIAQYMLDRRIEEAKSSISSSPKAYKPAENQVRVNESLVRVGMRSEAVTLGAYAAAYLPTKGVKVSKKAGFLYIPTSNQESGGWFTDNLEGPGDLAVTSRALKRYGTVRALLRAAGVPRVLGREVKTVSELEVFRRGRPRVPVTMLPARREWTSRLTRHVDASQVVPAEALENYSRWVVQLRQPGSRLRVIATQELALCVLGDDAGLGKDKGLIRDVGHLAVGAVRAVPELRWGTVDVLVRSNTEPGRSPKLLVEGLASSPRLHPSHIALTGGLPEAVEAIIGAPVDEVRVW